MFRSVVTKTSNPAASAASRSSPFRRVSQPRERASSTMWSVNAPATPLGVPLSNRIRINAGKWEYIQASSGKFQYRLDLSPSDRELLDHLVNGHAVLQIFKDDGHGCARSREDPRTAHLARNTFNARTLRPVETGHYGASLHHPVYGICAWRSHRTLVLSTDPARMIFPARSRHRLRRPLPMPRSRKKKKSPKRVLALPDLEQAKSAVLNTLTSKSGQRTYDHAITEFVEWYCSEPRLAFNRTVVLRYRISLEQRQYASSTINLRLAAVRRVAYEAADSGLLSPELGAGI